MPAAHCDLLISGGGITGAGIARDAAGRGLSVVLISRSASASATSSASSKLIHGGLRYLELYEFRLVAEALAEREILLGIAAHLTSPMRFVMPHVPELRPRWMIRVGLFLYDHLARRSLLPGSQAVRLDTPPYSDGLRPQLRHGFLYSDCAVDDSRLVVANALDARARGARLLVRTELLRARRATDRWQAELSNGDSLHARAVVNAAGPWGKQILNERLAQTSPGARGGRVVPEGAARRAGRGGGGARPGPPPRRAPPLPRRARLHPAERRSTRGVHDSVRGALHPHRDHGRAGSGRSGRRMRERGRGGLPLPRGQPLSRAGPAALRRGLALCRSPAAARRWVAQSVGGYARLHPAPGRSRRSNRRCTTMGRAIRRRLRATTPCAWTKSAVKPRSYPSSAASSPPIGASPSTSWKGCAPTSPSSRAPGRSAPRFRGATSRAARTRAGRSSAATARFRWRWSKARSSATARSLPKCWATELPASTTVPEARGSG